MAVEKPMGRIAPVLIHGRNHDDRVHSIRHSCLLPLMGLVLKVTCRGSLNRSIRTYLLRTAAMLLANPSLREQPAN
jgi:hypothetical protein